MKVHRFFTSWHAQGDTLTISDAAVCHQASRVLKLRPGERIAVCDGTGKEYACDIAEISPQEVRLTIIDERVCADAHLPHVTLCCALLKRENFEWVVQKATEVGVTRIVPLLTDRTIKTGLKHERLVKIAAEAAELSGRGRVPEITEPMTMEQALKMCNANDRHCFYHTESKEHVSDHSPLPAPRSVLWIGPEGGWSEREVALAKEYGLTFSTLGPLVLRGETAAVVATYVAVHGA